MKVFCERCSKLENKSVMIELRLSKLQDLIISKYMHDNNVSSHCGRGIPREGDNAMHICAVCYDKLQERK